MLAVVPATVTILLVGLAGYLIGSVPVANPVAARRGVPDLRTVGDRNPGYWNAKGQLGWQRALPIFAGDVLKGGAAAAIGSLLAGDAQWWLSYLAGGAAMAGHAWPVFAGFRGGRSVLTFVGAALICAPVPALLAVIGTGVVWGARREFALAAQVGVASFPVLQMLTEGARRTAATGALMTFVGLRFAVRRPVGPHTAYR
jgi:glycerol-3-phosphate acyltransferase PlsY